MDVKFDDAACRGFMVAIAAGELKQPDRGQGGCCF